MTEHAPLLAILRPACGLYQESASGTTSSWWAVTPAWGAAAGAARPARHAQRKTRHAAIATGRGQGTLSLQKTRNKLFLPDMQKRVGPVSVWRSRVLGRPLGLVGQQPFVNQEMAATLFFAISLYNCQQNNVHVRATSTTNPEPSLIFLCKRKEHHVDRQA